MVEMMMEQRPIKIIHFVPLVIITVICKADGPRAEKHFRKFLFIGISLDKYDYTASSSIYHNTVL